jgi:hypothetical protein
MKLGKAYEQGSRSKILSFFRFKVVIRYYMYPLPVSLGTLDDYYYSEKLRFVPLSDIIELHCKRRLLTRTDTENFIDRYRILYIFNCFFLFDFLLNIHV